MLFQLVDLIGIQDFTKHQAAFDIQYKGRRLGFDRATIFRDIPAALTATGLAEQEDWTEIGTALEELPSGEASMVRAIDPNGWPQQMWHMTDGDRWFRLICGVLAGDTEPREIAETFEFLPLPG